MLRMDCQLGITYIRTCRIDVASSKEEGIGIQESLQGNVSTTALSNARKLNKKASSSNLTSC